MVVFFFLLLFNISFFNQEAKLMMVTEATTAVHYIGTGGPESPVQLSSPARP